MKCAALIMAGLALSSCDAPGRRAAEVRVIRPGEVANFGELFSQNCSGCHGKDGQGALTVGIGRPVYLAIADDATIRRTIEEGRPGTPMPAFARAGRRGRRPASIKENWCARSPAVAAVPCSAEPLAAPSNGCCR